MLLTFFLSQTVEKSDFSTVFHINPQKKKKKSVIIKKKKKNYYFIIIIKLN